MPPSTASQSLSPYFFHVSASSMSSLLPTLSEVDEEEDTWSINSYDSTSPSSLGKQTLSKHALLHQTSLSNRSDLTVSTTSSSSSSSRSTRSSDDEEEEVDNPSTQNIHTIEDDDASSVQSMFSSDSATTMEDRDDEDHPTHPVGIAPNELEIIQEVVEAGDWDTLLILSNAIFEDEFAALAENQDGADDSSAVSSSSYSSSYEGDEDDLNSHCTNSHVQAKEEEIEELSGERNYSSQSDLFQAKVEDEDETMTSSSSELSQPQDVTCSVSKPRRWGLRRLLSRNTMKNTTSTKPHHRPVMTKSTSYTTRSQRTTLSTPPPHNSHSCRGPRRSIPVAEPSPSEADEIEQRRQQQKQQQQDEQILQGLEAVLEELRMRVRVSQHHLLNISNTSLHDPDDEKNSLVVQQQQIHQIENALSFYQNRLMRLSWPSSSFSNVMPTPPEILETLAMIPVIMSESI